MRAAGASSNVGTSVLRALADEPAVDSGWVDMALAVPLMEVARARDELGWRPRRGAGEALCELLDGMRDSAGLDTPPLEPGGAGPARLRELLTGVGGR